jgi:hypothetical protein
MTHGHCSGSSHRSASRRLQAGAPSTLLDALAAGLLALLACTASFAGSFPGANGRVAYTPSGFAKGIVVDGVGQLTFPVTQASEADIGPAYSPDGTRVAFLRGRPTRAGLFYQLYVINSDGSGLRRLVTAPSVIVNGRETFAVLSFPTWCINGATICYALRFPGIADPRNGVWKVPAAGGTTTQLVREDNANSVSGHPATQEVVYDCSFRRDPVLDSSRQDLCIHDSTTGAIHQLKIDGPGDTGQLRQASEPRWTPDGERIVFNWQYTSLDGIYVTRREIFSIGATGGAPQRLTDSGPPVCPAGVPTAGGGIRGSEATYGYDHAVPSPDGATIAVQRLTYFDPLEYCRGGGFLSNRPGARDGGIYAVPASGGGSAGVRIVADPEAQTSSFDWQPLPVDLIVNVLDSLGHPIDGLKLEIRDRETGSVIRDNPFNPGNGSYLFPEVPAGEHVVRVTLVEYSGGPGATPAFEIQHEPETGQAAWAEYGITVDAGGNEVPQPLPLDVVANMTDSSIKEIQNRSRFDDLGVIFHELYRYLGWARRTLAPDLGPTVAVRAFVTNDPRNSGQALPEKAAFYRRDVGGMPYIAFSTAMSVKEQRDGRYGPGRPDEGPENLEWHEYTHHLWFANVDNDPDTWGCGDQKNHAGIFNATSCDSVKEGVAVFFAAAAGRDLYGPGDRFYADRYDLEEPWKAWYTEPATEGVYGREDVAVAALLWDLYDEDGDVNSSVFITGSGTHSPVGYRDQQSESVTDLWQRFVSGRIKTVRQLRQSYGAAALTRNLDDEGVNDIATIDEVFLMHGFHPLDKDQRQPAPHPPGYHYDVDYAQDKDAAAPRNDAVGFTHVRIYGANDVLENEFLERPKTPINPASSLKVSIRDAAGRTLAGGEVDLVMQTPGEAPVTVTRRVGSGDGDLIGMQFQPYYAELLPVGTPLPDCDPATQRISTVTVRARVNGYQSTDQPAFDSCTFQRAAATVAGASAVAVSAAFPEDGTPPESTATSASSGPVLVDGSTTGFWTVRLGCEDPVVDGFASGCNRIEYRLDGGEIARYSRSLRVATVGPHVVEYRSVDGAGNAEAFRSLRVDVAGADTDNDGLSDAVEAALGTDPGDDDSDDDSVKDGLEVQLGSDPRNPDSDGDGLPDGKELQLGTAVLGGDSDEDGLADGADNCPLLATPRAEQDTDGDGSGNACDSDDDGDGTPDTQDNCTLLPNGQRDTDGDGYGNACDPDLDNSGIVNFRDLAMFRMRFNSFNADADFNESGVVDSADLDRLRQFFGKPPGPSGTR